MTGPKNSAHAKLQRQPGSRLSISWSPLDPLETPLQIPIHIQVHAPSLALHGTVDKLLSVVAGEWFTGSLESFRSHAKCRKKK